MEEAITPPDEAARLDAVRSLALLDTPQEERFDRITRVAAALFDVPICTITLIDHSRQWFKSCVGLDLRETPRAYSFCAHALLHDDPMVIPDATKDPLFAGNPLVTGPPGVRFYAGHPLSSPDGFKLGTLCVIDRRPRTLDAEELLRLRDLARLAEHELNALELSQALTRLGESERHLRAVMDGVAEGIVTFGADGRILSANRAALVDFRATPGELIGRSVARLVDGMGLDEIQARVGAVQPGAELAQRPRVVVTGRRSDGTLFPLELAISQAEIAGRPVFIGIGMDVTERREAERVKDEFVSVVSHELRTPLTSIRGSLGLVTGGVMGELPAEVVTMLAVAEQNAERLVRLVNDILDIERLGSGLVELELADVEARGLLVQGVDTVATTARDADVTIRVEADPDLRVRADERRVVQTLTNLLGNALKFAPPGTEVVATAAADGPQVRFSVADQGRGIPPELLDGIFDRFRQVDASDSREKGGTGLGLAIARTIVEQHGGRIWAQSPPQAGATFHFTLPRHAAGLDVVIIADDAGEADRLAEQIRALGQQPHVAASAEEAIAHIAATAPCALLLPLGDRCAELRAQLALDATARAIPTVLVGPALATDELLAELRRAIPLLGPGAVLIVEDDPSLGPILRRALEGAGIPARLARDGAEAVAAVREAPPGLVVLDLVLPDAEGFAVVDRLRADGLLADTPLLVYTALDLDAAGRRRLDREQAEFLGKADATPQDVQRRVSELLGRVAGGRTA